MADTFRVGVLIIGSLYWDNNTRARWRRSRLLMAEAEQVYLPMRYGRLSKSKKRQNTHTMVFSHLCYRQQDLGIGYVVPCCRRVQCWKDLKREVDELAAAEGLPGGSGAWKGWGAVGLLKNPSVHLPDSLLKPWQDYFRACVSGSTVFSGHAKSEPAIIRKNGPLRLRWPKLVKGGVCDLDLLLATPTAPTLVAGRYPSTRTIAEAYVHAKLPDYFLKNIKSGIRTSQDEAIARRLTRLQPLLSEQIRSVFQKGLD